MTTSEESLSCEHNLLILSAILEISVNQTCDHATSSPLTTIGTEAIKPFLISWGTTAVVFLTIDAIWLGLIATSFYRRELGALMLDQPKLHIAALFYIGYTFAIVLLAAAPAARSGSFSQALLYGAVLGLAAYGTYDITNLSTLKNWPAAMTLVDMAWGTCLTATAAAAGYAAFHYSS